MINKVSRNTKKDYQQEIGPPLRKNKISAEKKKIKTVDLREK
jgi:hypothetical protein